MKNPCLAAALAELESAGIRDVEQVRGGKHVQVRWKVNGHGLRAYTLPSTPSDIRASRNTRAGIRRMLRADGVITERERLEPKPPIKVDRVSALERRVEALERKLSGLHARHEPSVCGNPNGSQEN
jgi:hypothetical protein